MIVAVLAFTLVGTLDMIGDPVNPHVSKMIGDPTFTPRVIPAAWRAEPAPKLQPEPEPEPAPPAKVKPPPPLPVAPPKPAAKPPVMPPPVAPPTVYQLKDASGRTWTHTDPVWLQTYVGQVNASQMPTYAAPVSTQSAYEGFASGASCAGGSCGTSQSSGFFRGIFGR